VRNKGFRVTELSDVELDQIQQLRLLIEVPTVCGLARRHTEQQSAEIEHLRPLARQIVERAEQGDLIGYVEADRQFHLRLLALSGNDHLVRVVGELRARSRLYGLDDMVARGELAASANEHEHLLDLVLAGDVKAVRQLMHAHIRHVRGAWAGKPEG
jgi:DNA-binding GntR family transcriptional regulator